VLTLANVANAGGQGLANAWTTYSSRRWKTDITTLDGALNKVQQLRGVYYRPVDDTSRQIGFIAEEVGEIIPEVVTYEENGTDARSMDYARLTAVLVEAVKEQAQIMNSMRAELEALKQEIKQTATSESSTRAAR
jgi:hypothetical protein